jgi:hypothetical protein
MTDKYFSKNAVIFDYKLSAFGYSKSDLPSLFIDTARKMPKYCKKNAEDKIKIVINKNKIEKNK